MPAHGVEEIREIHAQSVLMLEFLRGGKGAPIAESPMPVVTRKGAAASRRLSACRLDVDARRLFRGSHRGSREVPLSPKTFELLASKNGTLVGACDRERVLR